MYLIFEIAHDKYVLINLSVNFGCKIIIFAFGHTAVMRVVIIAAVFHLYIAVMIQLGAP